MNTEVAGTPMKELFSSKTFQSNGTIFDTDPAEWGSIGIETLDDGSNITKTFDELWDMYQNPDYGDVSLHNEIMQQLLNFTIILSEASELVDESSTVDLDQVAYSIGTIIDNKDFTVNNTASNAFKGNMILLDKLIKLADNDTYPKYEDYIITCQAVLRVLNNALEAILPKTSVETPSQLDIYTIMSDISNRQEFGEPNDADLTPAERAFIASQIAMKNELDAEIENDVVQNEISVLLDSISHLGKVLQMLNYRKQMPVNTENGHINCTQDKKLIGDLIKDGFNQDNVKLNFAESDSRSLEEQNVQVIVYDHTPYSWDDESKFITSKTVTVSVGNDNTINAAIPSKIKLQNNVPAKKSIQIAIPTDKSEPTSQMMLYKMFLKTPSDNLMFSITKAADHLSHAVYIQSKHPPTEDTYDWKRLIEPGDWVSTDEIKIMFDSGLYTQPSNVYIGVRVYLEDPATDISTRKRRSLTTTIVQYEMIGATAGCRVWDTVNEKWDKSSCKLSSSSTINETVCECSNPPGNSFATTFYVPPNTIDFGSVFDKFDLKNNAGVFATVISLVLVYLLICVWAYRQDRADHQRWALSYLIDNGPYDEYLYIMTVYTGLHRHAGTKSNVNFQIIDGDPATKKHISTETRTLDDGTHQGFGVGSIRKFVMSASSKINDPSALRIWHDNSGQGNAASWYLNKIILEDMQTDERYLFMCNQWLSLDHDDGCIDCSIPLTNNSETCSFSSLFYERTRENTVDKHMWLSVAIRPEDSNFTRLERLACCLTLLFLTMISNAMFYGQDNGGSISVGPIEFSLSGIYISFISALIAAPPIFLVTYLYKNSKCRQLSRNKDAKALNGKSEPPLKPANEKRADDLIEHDIYKKNIVPQKSEVIAKMKEERKQRLTIQKKFIELVLYIIFLAVLYCVSFSNRDSRWYNINQHLHQQLVTPLNVSAGDGTVMFNQVKTTSDFYAWLDQTLIPFLFPRYHTNGYQLTANERLFVQDQDNVRIGPMRLRQVRTVEESCKTRLWDNVTCYEKYFIHREEDHSYCVGWESPPCIRGQSVYNMTFAAWKFVSSAEIWGLPVNGLHSYYSGGGYVAEFVVNYNISRLLLSDLYKYTWIDRQTRAIFTEFSLYNANDNVFTYVTFLSEFPETGGVITSLTIQPFRPYQHIGSLGLFIFICEIILVIGMVVFAIRKIVFLANIAKGRTEIYGTFLIYL
ncbi:PKD1L2 [Mytilus coruscus]|uniref:PKD1L2 n=1 Tax=Mytilus coruscus TaxID=42192 RepID=A0A6J8CBH5_MYTCO|nr:PKD1L2 [Mytilus coruscus]